MTGTAPSVMRPVQNAALTSRGTLCVVHYALAARAHTPGRAPHNAPGLFAAVAPVCGAGQVDAAELGDTAVWAFHGANDAVVPVRCSDGVVASLRTLRGDTGGLPGGEGAAAAPPVPETKYTRYDRSPAPVGW